MWRHVVDKEWMMARTHYLTASSIKNILPVTETGRKRSQAQIEANMLKIASSFATAYISDEDCVATGMAARGHLLEPIAIEEANKGANLGLYHWDDIILVNNLLGWSPDAMSIPQTKKTALYDIKKDGAPCPASIGEVKSYGMERHMVSVHTDKKNCPERWQLAVGMALLKNCQFANLIFFNPDSNIRLAIKTYSRQDLEEEIKMVKEAETSFIEFLHDENRSGIEKTNDFYEFNTKTAKNSDYYMNVFMKGKRMNI